MNKKGLKKEAKEWCKSKNITSSNGYFTADYCIQSYIAGAESREKQIAKLENENENAELKDKNKALEQYADLADAKVDEVKIKLIKAKALLKEWIIYRGGTREFHSPLQDKTEEFLKELEK